MLVEIEQICSVEIHNWNNTLPCRNLDRFQVSKEQAQRNKAQIQLLVEKMEPYLKSFPARKSLRGVWKKKGEAFMQDYLANDGIFLLKDMRREDSECFLQISKEFIRDARAFDDQLSLADIGQAMRNVWIIIILQRIFYKDVKYHKAMFAYSMLYPYSDNYLDDASIPKEEKALFNAWFSSRLKGEAVVIKNDHEEKISQLVSFIETVFDRSLYPHVYESLLYIQDAQILSLHQQDGQDVLSREQLTYISYRKGGTSVIADGFLINGTMSEAQCKFCMNYGFMLQIGDDLQDAKEDALHHHQTLVSTSLDKPLDDLLYHLIQYTQDILQPQSICQDKELLDFVIHDCLQLLFLAVAQNKEYYSARCYEEVCNCLGMDLESIEEMRKSSTFSMSEEAMLERIDALVEA